MQASWCQGCRSCELHLHVSAADQAKLHKIVLLLLVMLSCWRDVHIVNNDCNCRAASEDPDRCQCVRVTYVLFQY